MYKIYAGGLCIYDDTSPLPEYKVVSPKLSLSDNSAGSLTMTVPPTNVGYSEINRLTTEIIVTENGEEIWRGRVLTEKTNFWKCRELTCEGELAYLNDTVQPPYEFKPEEGRKWDSSLVKEMLWRIIYNHNINLSPNDPIDKKFEIGQDSICDVEDLNAGDDVYRYTNYESTLEAISKNMVDALGGHLRVRHVTDSLGRHHRYLDYIKNYSRPSNGQVIEFGKNLMDFTRNFSVEDFSTVIIPKGKQLDEEVIEGLYSYRTVASGVSPEIQEEFSRYHNEGEIYVYDHDQTTSSAVNTYGRIETVYDLSEVDSPDELLLKSVAYLSNVQFDKMTLEVQAIDFHNMNVDERSFKLLDEIRVISPPHGMDRYFPLTKIELSLDNPGNTTYTLGDETVQKLTVTTRKLNEQLIEQINKTVTLRETAVQQAKRYAADLINHSTGGYVTLVKDPTGDHVESLIISDISDYTDPRATGWKWNYSGLAFFPNGFSAESTGLALTNDGSIVADLINAGSLDAGIIKTGQLKFYDSETGETKFSLDFSNGALVLGGYSKTTDVERIAEQAKNDAITEANANTNQKISFDPTLGLKIFGDGSGGGNNYVLISSTSQQFVVDGVSAMLLDANNGIITKGLNAQKGFISGGSVTIKDSSRTSTSSWSWITDDNGTLKLIRSTE